MKVCFISNSKAFMPELDAYIELLTKEGIDVCLAKNKKVARTMNADLYFRFGGIIFGRVDWTKSEIHEYHSASTGIFPRFKNMVKSVLSSHADGFCFLNYWVQKQFIYSSKKAVIIRDMGAEKKIFRSAESNKKIYDIVYAGSISGKPGLIEEVTRLSKLGVNIVIAGTASDEEKTRLHNLTGVTFLGRISREEVIELYSKSRFGLNYIPEMYPFTDQTSTKIIEYLVAGLPIISNEYQWISSHSGTYGYDYLRLNLINTKHDLVSSETYIISDDAKKKFLWNNVIDESDLIEVIKSLISK